MSATGLTIAVMPDARRLEPIGGPGRVGDGLLWNTARHGIVPLRKTSRSPPGRERDVTEKDYLEDVPTGPELTDYDRRHQKLYMRLHDSADDGADWREAVQILFGLDPEREPERARRIYDSHLARARWMKKDGYKLLLRDGR